MLINLLKLIWQTKWKWIKLSWVDDDIQQASRPLCLSKIEYMRTKWNYRFYVLIYLQEIKFVCVCLCFYVLQQTNKLIRKHYITSLIKCYPCLLIELQFVCISNIGRINRHKIPVEMEEKNWKRKRNTTAKRRVSNTEYPCSFFDIFLFLLSGKPYTPYSIGRQKSTAVYNWHLFRWGNWFKRSWKG